MLSLKSEDHSLRTGYYKETVNGRSVYRIYTVDPYNFCDLAHPMFSGVHYGDVKLPQQKPWMISDMRGGDIEPQKYHSSAPKITNGFLLGKNGQLIETPGIVVIPKKPFSHNYLVLAYYRNPDFHQMCMEEVAILSKTSFDQPGVAALINILGGFEALDQMGIGFLPDINGSQTDVSSRQDATLTVVQARMLLPALYQLEESGKLRRSIELLESIVLEHEVSLPQFNEVLQQDATTIETQRAQVEFDRRVELPYSYPDLASEIRKEMAEVLTGVSLTVDKARTKAVANLRAKIKPTKAEIEIQKERLRAQRKTEKLTGIGEHFKRIAAQQSHYDTDAARQLVERLHCAFESHGVVSTGEGRTRGSHEAEEFVNTQTGARVLMGMVRRPTSEGFESGTLKAIINDHVERAIRTLLVTLEIP